MSNLNIENLSRVVDAGDVAGLMGTQAGAPSEVRTLNEMHAQGMQASPEGAGQTFSDMLRHSVEQVNQDQVEANQAINEMIAGRNKNIHETMLAVERADTSLKLMMQVRNKVLDAYREIMRMQV